MSTEENKAVVRRYLDQMDRGKGVVAEDLLAPDYRHYLPGAPDPLDRQGDAYLHGMFYSAFPDLYTTIEEMIAEGDQVVTRGTWRGTHQGDFQGIPATSRQIAFTGIQILRIVDGKIVEHRSEFDALGLMQQLGAIPAPQPAA